MDCQHQMDLINNSSWLYRLKNIKNVKHFWCFISLLNGIVLKNRWILLSFEIVYYNHSSSNRLFKLGPYQGYLLVPVKVIFWCPSRLFIGPYQVYLLVPIKLFIGPYQGYLLRLETLDALQCTRNVVFIAMET